MLVGRDAAELVPLQRRRGRSARAGPRRVGHHRGLAVGVAADVEEGPAAAGVLAHLRRELVGVVRGDGLGDLDRGLPHGLLVGGPVQRRDDVVAAAAGALQEGDEAAALDGVPHGPRHVPDAGEVLALAGVDVDDQPVGTLERARDDVPAVQRDGAELDEPDEVGGLLDLGVVHDVVRVLLALAARGVDGVQALRRALPGVLLDEPAGVQAVGEALQGQRAGPSGAGGPWSRPTPSTARDRPS